jgi:hypothetical protein
MRNINYFNNAGQAELSLEVQKVGLECIRTPPWCGQNERAALSLTRVRQLFASLIGVSSSVGRTTNHNNNENNDDEDGGISSSDHDEDHVDVVHELTPIAIMPSTAFAITLAARNLQRTVVMKDDDDDVGNSDSDRRYRIIVLQDQFDSAIYPWQQVCDESNGRVRLDIIAHPPDDEDNGWTEAIMRSITNSFSGPALGGDGTYGADDGGRERILAVCLPPVHWSNGTILDLDVIGTACLERDIPLIVDGTQGKNDRTLTHFHMSHHNAIHPQDVSSRSSEDSHQTG